MSLLTLGMNDVTEEMQAHKDKLGSKAQQGQLMRKAAELEEIRASLNEAVRKLNEETQRALKLETDLQKCAEDLRNEKVTSENQRNALSLAQEKMKAKDLEARELEATLDSMSHASDGYNAKAAKVEKEKGALEARVRELEANLRQLSSPPVTPGKQLRMPRPRSSSLSNLRITTLETELSDARALLSQKEANLQAVNGKLDGVQQELVQANNERIALDARSRKRIQELEDLLNEREEDLEYLQNGQDGQGREEELLRRIDEDEAKIEALERLVGDAHEVPFLRKRLRQAEQQLLAQAERREQGESRNAELVQDREEALDQVERARKQIDVLEATIRERDDEIAGLKQQSPSPPAQDPQAVQNMERLLNAIDRLRGERDDLQRGLDFLTAESKFKVAALEAKVASFSTSSPPDSDMADSLHSKHDVRLNKATLAFAIVIGHLHNSLTTVTRDLSQTSALNKQKTEALLAMEGTLRQVEDRLRTSLESLEEATSHRNDLFSQLEEANAAHDETKSSLMRLDGQLSEISDTLQEVESKRDSLSLQVTNLTTDLRVAQGELAEAEKRYSSLQFHQLSNMSSTEATSALRKQIEELEGRVVRRNEQIGIHQHDIKRLETNLRLNEDRLTELTAEMETLASQKEAMVEDCADAREARDDAIARVEVLEEEIERVESQLVENEQTLAALVGVTFQVVARSKEKVRLAEERVISANAKAKLVQKEHEHTLMTTSELELAVRERDGHLKDREEDIHRVVVALAVSQENLAQTSHSIHTLMDEKARLAALAKQLQEEVSSHAADKDVVASQLESLRAGSSGDLEAKISRITNLELEADQLRETIAELEKSHIAKVEELETLILKKDEQLTSSDLEGEVVQLKMRHIEELGRLQSQLVETSAALEEIKARQAATELEYEEKLSASVRSGQAMRKELSDLREDLAKSKESEQNSVMLKLQQEKKVEQLKEELSVVARETQELKRNKLDAEASFDTAIDEITRQRTGLEKEVHRLKGELEDTQAQLEIARADAARVSANSTSLSDRLKEEVEAHEHEKSLLQGELLSQKTQIQQMQTQLDDLIGDVSAIEEQLKQSENDLELSQAEKHRLQCDMTALEAEIQRAKSYNRYLESQIKESLESEIESIRDNLAQAQKACNTAEMNFNLQSAQHKREMLNLTRELASLKARPNLEDALAELEERNNEMEELLKLKCAEIEENDDRVIEMLKENKKLSSKVEALTRKVQNLQAKLAAAKASTASETRGGSSSLPSQVSPNLVIQSRSSRNSITMTNSSSPASESSERAALITAPYQERTRVHSAAASTRPVTPEKSSAPLPVFKPNNPKRRSVDIDVPPSVMTGKKRSAPEDFETNRIVPAQAFTAESLPGDKEESSNSTTPRVRRVLSNIQSGFTPSRNRTPTVAAPITAPETIAPKDSATPTVSVNPSGMDGKAIKRGSGWLGKIRGASSHPRPNGG
ncbi:hypothetical protein Moror_15991 [Moniliophthora roreri MCA 2997]|uniref:Uncharacterized protein n=1 Tax=Moniliophthora roreri (strain MCA 2997) TaxID=1381753 RepID=V2XIP6_MONRO|nr:hypothetical protein Moror_15991 [Moniliophthora roreri MCA 2997]